MDVESLSAWPAPAKLNLFLHVVGRRADGYHLLQTVFQLLDIGDTVRLRVRDDARIERLNPLTGVPPEQDLCVRAARLLQQEARCSAGVDIALEKRIPMGGGLGGGSSDAATVLLALNQLWNLHWPLTRLAQLALRLGADVPVFIHGENAWAEGVGERLTKLELPPQHYVVICPGISVPTAQIFADPELTRSTPPITIRDFLAGRGRNDLEPVARRRFPAVDALLGWLGQFGNARMTGSGASVFLPVRDSAAAQAVLAAFGRDRPLATTDAQTGSVAFSAQGVSRHPLHRSLNLPCQLAE
mgnify:CR=1 FL=1